MLPEGTSKFGCRRFGRPGEEGQRGQISDKLPNAASSSRCSAALRRPPRGRSRRAQQARIAFLGTSLRPPINIFSTHSAKGCVSMVIGDEFSSKWLELLKEAVPNVSRVAILCTEAWIEGTNSACGGHIASCHPAWPYSLAAMKATTFDSDCICLMILPTSSFGSLVSERRMR